MIFLCHGYARADWTNGVIESCPCGVDDGVADGEAVGIIWAEVVEARGVGGSGCSEDWDGKTLLAGGKTSTNKATINTKRAMTIKAADINNIGFIEDAGDALAVYLCGIQYTLYAKK